jgi:uncharacterized membrane protein YedE/YeeE
MNKKKWDPVFGGIMIGLAMVLTFAVAGRGLGASGALTRIIAWLQSLILPSYTQSSAYFGKYFAHGAHPMDNYLINLLIGIVVGAMAAGFVSGNLKKEILKGPNISGKGRLWFALFGGVLVGFAARLGRGCTSGQALVGGAELSVGSWVFMIMIFAGGFAAAYFVRRQWL